MPEQPLLLRIDVPGHQAWLGGQKLRFTASQFQLLALLAANAGKVMHKQALIDAVWGGSEWQTSGSLSMLVLRVRRKIDVPGYISTELGIGFRFERAMLDPASVFHEPTAPQVADEVSERLDRIEAAQDRIETALFELTALIVSSQAAAVPAQGGAHA